MCLVHRGTSPIQSGGPAVITRATCADDFGVRHMVFILVGYPSCAAACSMRGFKVDRIDPDYEPITCVTCAAFEAKLGHGQRR